MVMQIQQPITVRRKVTLTMNTSVQFVNHAHSQGEKCFQREKIVSIVSEVCLILTVQWSELWFCSSVVLHLSEVLHSAVGIPDAELCAWSVVVGQHAALGSYVMLIDIGVWVMLPPGFCFLVSWKMLGLTFECENFLCSQESWEVHWMFTWCNTYCMLSHL
jgi:hypothetical protein